MAATATVGFGTLARRYKRAADNALAVMTSRDGVGTVEPMRWGLHCGGYPPTKSGSSTQRGPR